MSDSETPRPGPSSPGNSGPGPADSGRRKVFLTGATGFVGGYVLRELLAKGYSPVCLVRDADKLNRSLADEQVSRVVKVVGDLFDQDALRHAAAGCEAAIHLVGIIEEKPSVGRTFSRIHTQGTRQVVEACERTGIKRYAHMSALGVRSEAVSKYHQTKWFAEEIVRQSSLNWTIFRPSLIHGPEGEFMGMMKFFATSRVRQPVMPYFGSGETLVQPVSVRDVATCFVECLSRPQTIGQVYELGGPERMTWKEMYDICAQAIAGRTRTKVSVPVPVARCLARTVMPWAPSALVPYKFNLSQVQMSQENSVCDTAPVESTFGIRLRDFREELSYYADQIR